MSKIICDVCGTSYAETATQCPICGSVRPGNVTTVSGSSDKKEEQTTNTYTYVKGGRFSKANVRKRNKERMASGQYEPDMDEYAEDNQEKGNTGLVIAVIALALAIIAAVIYIVSQFYGGIGRLEPTVPYVPQTTEQTHQTEDTSAPTELEIPCEDIVISKKKVEFEKKGASYLLNVTTMPKDTTDEITFTSGDENVATVTAGGKITAVGSGETVITVICGDKATLCDVVCTFENETEETTEPTTQVDENFELKLNREDFTLTGKGDTWKLYSGEIAADKITWTTDDEKVVTIKNGVVTATGKGMTQVHGEYGGKKVSCIVRCADSVGEYKAETETETEIETENKNYKISATDVTIVVGEKFTLTLKNKDNETVTVTWTVSDPDRCTVSGNEVTGAAVGDTTITTDIDGEFYQCIVRVRAGETETD